MEGQQRFSSPGKLSKLFMMSGLLFQVNPTIGIGHNLTRTRNSCRIKGSLEPHYFKEGMIEDPYKWIARKYNV
jgi:hypothetical protein